MPSVTAITDYFERFQRNVYRNRNDQPRWAIIALGIFLLGLGAITSIMRHGIFYGRFSFALGLAAVFFGVTDWVLRDSSWRWATRVIAFGMWATDFWLILHG
jgi:hypothetical protein